MMHRAEERTRVTRPGCKVNPIFYISMYYYVLLLLRIVASVFSAIKAIDQWS